MIAKVFSIIEKKPSPRHCKARSDEAIRKNTLDCFAPLAMTKVGIFAMTSEGRFKMIRV
jgi:hypothetical protein